MILQYVARKSDRGNTHVAITPCGDMNNEFPLWDDGRDEEFAALLHDHSSPCLPYNISKHWSCVKYYTREDIAARDKSLYGFQPGEVGNKQQTNNFIIIWFETLIDWLFQTHERRTYQTYDTSYTAQIAKVPKVTPDGAGYQKMTMTNKMKELLLEW